MSVRNVENAHYGSEINIRDDDVYLSWGYLFLFCMTFMVGPMKDCCCAQALADS